MARVIAVVNQKGGVGKTTSTVNLGAALSEKSLRVLLIDLDPAGNMTNWLSNEESSDQNGLSDLLRSEMKFENTVQKSERLGLDYLPCGKTLRNLTNNGFSDLFALKNRLSDAIKNYDYVIIDCPPSSDILVGNALMAAESIIIPIQTETMPLQAGINFLDWLGDFSARHGISIDIMGILPCMYDSRTRLSKMILDAMRSSENIGPLVFDTVIRKNVRLAELSGSDRSIFRSASTSFGASDYTELAKEVIERADLRNPDTGYFSAESSEQQGEENEYSDSANQGDDVPELVYHNVGSEEYKDPDNDQEV